MESASDTTKKMKANIFYRNLGYHHDIYNNETFLKDGSQFFYMCLWSNNISPSTIFLSRKLVSILQQPYTNNLFLHQSQIPNIAIKILPNVQSPLHQATSAAASACRYARSCPGDTEATGGCDCVPTASVFDRSAATK